jgi:hypothetical protein
MNCPNSGIRCQLQKSSKNRPGSSGRDATSARSLGSARLRSIPAREESHLLRRERAANADGAVALEVVVAGHRPILVTMGP